MESKQPNKKYAYGFLIHLRNISDVERKFPFFAVFPKTVKELLVKRFPPVVVSKITGLRSLKNNEDLNGLVISIPLTARQMLEDRNLAQKKMLQALRFAEKKGVRIMALGALTASLTHGGNDLAHKTSVSLTTGHAFTVVNVANTVLKILERTGRTPKNTKLAIVGASGSIGSNSARILCKKGFKELLLVDIERKNVNLKKLVDELRIQCPELIIKTSHQIQDIKESNCIITATNAPEALVKNEDLGSGSIVIDDAQPSDIHPEVFEREDVLVLEAGAVHTPGISVNFNLDLKNKHDNFACLAEVLTLVAHSRYDDYVLGNLTFDKVEEILELSKSLNFSVAEFQNQKEKIGFKKLESIAEIQKS